MQSRASKKVAPGGAKDLGPRNALGRGLASLMSGPAPSASAAHATGFRMLPIERIEPNKDQPRKSFEPEALQELAESIKVQGVLQPIIVRRQGDAYQIVAGERRWRAAAQAGLREVPAMVKELTDSSTLQIALIENIQRRDLDPLEEAEAYARLIDEHSLKHDELAAAVGKNRVTITNSLRLLKLPPAVLKMLSAGDITASHARALLSVPTASQAIRLAEQVIERKMSVRDTEERAKQLQRASTDKKDAHAPHSAAASAKEHKRSPDIVDLEERLQRCLGTKVRIFHTNGAGRIEVSFSDPDALDALLDKMTGY